MSRSIHFASRSIPGRGPPDIRCLPCSSVSAKTVGLSFCSHSKLRRVYDMKLLSLTRSSRQTYVLCNASSSNYRRNSDFSRQKKNVYSRNESRFNEEKDGYEDLEDSETFSSRNGPLLSVTGNQKFQATSAPGPREKEIVELFRKVQAQLRERAALKEEKKVEDSQGKGKEKGTVDSLLKLLRKHSVQQGKKKTSSVNDKEFILDEPEHVGTSTRVERSRDIPFSKNTPSRHERQEILSRQSSRPKSVFRRRSPVPESKLQPVYTDGYVNPVKQDNTDVSSKGSRSHPEAEYIDELKIEQDAESDLDPLFSEENVFDEMIEDGTSEIYESDHEHDNMEEEHDEVKVCNLNGMKLSELKTLAKSRGLKGFSKLKKNELIELLSESSA